MDLTLRQQTLRALGWILTQDPPNRYFLLRPVTGDPDDFVEVGLSVDKEGIWEMGPAIESDEGIAVRALTEFCRVRGFNFELRYYDDVEQSTCEIEMGNYSKVLRGNNSFPEAICRALIEAAKGQSK